MFWKKRNHKLPKFPPTAADVFRELCRDLPAENIEVLRDALNKHFDKEQSRDHSETKFNQVEHEEVREACNLLLDIYNQQPPAKRKMIIGAVRYAAAADDPFCDSTFASGLDDDKKIINYVLEELGVEDRYLKIY